MKDLDLAKTIQILDTIIEFELAGVVRYTHYALMVTGPHRIPIVQFPAPCPASRRNSYRSRRAPQFAGCPD
jgi:hypothetical protein